MDRVHAAFTAEQLYEIANGRRVELVNGELLAMTPVGGYHGQIVLRLGQWILDYLDRSKLGWLGTELGHVLTRDPDTVRAPDISFLSSARYPQGLPETFLEGPPDLAVEVLSPDDVASKLRSKVVEYLRAGCRLVWVVDPRSRTVTAYHPGGDAHVYTADQPVPGGEVLPGFSFKPSDLFSVNT